MLLLLHAPASLHPPPSLTPSPPCTPRRTTTSGKTRLINHFIINDAWYLVDLPGYGWVGGGGARVGVGGEGWGGCSGPGSGLQPEGGRRVPLTRLYATAPACRYARMSKDKTMEWNAFTRQYFTERETLVRCVFVWWGLAAMPRIAC